MKILIADDEPGARLIIEAALKGLGHQCRSANDGAAAWEAFQADRPDVVISDWSMPGLSGIDLCRNIRSGGGGYTYFVLLTGREGQNHIIEGMNAGADDYLAKPLRVDDLQVRLIAAARVTSLHREIEAVSSERATIAGSLADAQKLARVGSWELGISSEAVRWSTELYRLFGFSPDQKPSYEALLDRIHPDDRLATVEAILATSDSLRPFQIEHRIVLPDGSLRWIRARGRVELDGRGVAGHLIGTAEDITEQKTAEDALIHQAFHDSLSGLPNRLLFLARLSQALEQLGPAPSTLGVIYLDIDRFKVINDSMGHPVGDQLLLAVANRLTRLVRPADTLARMGGDEFVILCVGMANEAAVINVADRICAAMTEPLVWSGGELVLSVSAGIAVATSAAVSPDDLLRDADAAMYMAKSSGRACSVLFADVMRTRAVGRLDTEMSLRRSIAAGDLRVHYQAIVNLAGDEIVGHEALVRWAHPTRGLLGPDQFISIAEETGLIVPLGAWVLREACLQAKRFQDRAPRWAELTMSVNLSGAQLGRPDLVALIASALEESQLRPAHLQLEMTESVLMEDAATTITVLQALKDLGVHLGIDDFGTGYSSLSYLKRFPVDVLKIDRSFVQGLGSDHQDTALVAAVLSLAGALGLTALAEGVETSLQRDSLIELGCPRAQGYLFARPCPAMQAEAALDVAAALQWRRPGAAVDQTAAV